MKDRNELLAALQASPDALLLIEEVKQAIEQEIAKRKEFYELIHEDCKAEFINGEIIFHSPVRRRHWRISMKLSRLLDEYVNKHDLGEVGVEKVMITLSRNDYEPDIYFFSKEKAKDFTDDQLTFPAPDFIVEITSKSTRERDYGIKFRDYAAHGIPEYWIVDPDEQTIEQYLLKGKTYQLHQKVAEEKLTSFVVKGFSIEIQDVFS